MWQGMYEFELRQWGVGHGGLHSQRVSFTTSPSREREGGFSFVYDCGSGTRRKPRTQIRDAIERMLCRFEDLDRIDLLAISHFDQDHVNGIQLLADRLDDLGINVRRVWAPIITPIEALYALSTGRARTDRSFVSLVTAPRASLRQLFRTNNVQLLGPEIVLDQVDGPVDDASDDAAPIRVRIAGDGRGLVVKGDIRSGDEVLWEVRPYVAPGALRASANLPRTLGCLLGKDPDQWTIDDIVTVIDDHLLLREFASMVDRENRSWMDGRGPVGRVTGSNLSSLCIYSGPAEPGEWCGPIFSRVHSRRGPVVNGPYAPAWLGTGDAGLLSQAAVDDLRDGLGPDRLERVGVCSVPHHGSRHNSGDPLWHELPNLRAVTIEANHATGGPRIHHPHSSVLQELARHPFGVHVCLDDADLCWRDLRCR